MNKNTMKRVLPIALFSAFVACVLSLSACSSDKSSKQKAVSDEPLYAVQIHVDCDQNLVFSKYDVDVKVDGDEIGNVDHGSKSTFEVSLTKGQHELVFVEENRTSPDGKTSFVVEGEGDKFSYTIHCENDQIRVESTKDEAEEQVDGEADDDVAEEGPAKDDAAKNDAPGASEDSMSNADAGEESEKSGVFEYSYVKHPATKTQYSYDIYFLFDEDTHVAVDFTSDGPEGIATWPYRGNFNDGVELDLIDSGEVVAHWNARWKNKDSPETLIVTDDDGFEYEYEKCPESEALTYFSDAMWERIGL